MAALVDANVWLPILVERHEHHQAATTWWDNAPAESAVWCRVTQLAILRLLSNQTVMGANVLSPEMAWQTWQLLAMDERTSQLIGEPRSLDQYWQSNLRGRVSTPKLWADAYLAALAESASLAMVTFDKGFKNFTLSNLIHLKH